MKKKRIQLIVLLIICLLCIGAYFLVKHLDLSETEETAPEAAVVTDFSSEEVRSLSVTGDHTLNFVKEEDTWHNADDREVNLDQTKISALINNINHITTDTVVEAPENLAEYGLDNPVRTITAGLENGSSVILYVGNANDITGDYYIRMEGNGQVYAVSSYIVTAFDREPADFIEETPETTEESAEENTEESTEAAETESVTESGMEEENTSAESTFAESAEEPTEISSQ